MGISRLRRAMPGSTARISGGSQRSRRFDSRSAIGSVPLALMRASRTALSLALGVALAAAAAPLAWAGDNDLEDDEDTTTDAGPQPVQPPKITIRTRTYTLAECLALADRN